MAIKPQKQLDLESYTYSIYHITSPLSKSNGYVGMTKLPIEKRLDKHFSHAVEDKASFDNGKIHRIRTVLKALLKYGKDNITIKKLDECVGYTKACELEVKYIAELNTFKNGWNETVGGEGQPSCTPDEATRKKISEANKGRVRTEEAVLENRERAKARYAAGFAPTAASANRKQVTIDGVHFQSIKEACEYFKVDSRTVKLYDKRGTSEGASKESILIYGVEYPSKVAAYKALGWHKQNYYNYLIYGQPTAVKGVPLYVDGVKYNNLAEIRKDFDCGTVKAMSLATGANHRENTRAREVKIADNTFETVKDAADYYGVSKTAIYSVINGKEKQEVFAKYRYEGLYFSTESSFKRLTGLTSWFFREWKLSGKIESVIDEHIRFDSQTGKRLTKTESGWVS